MIIIKSKSIGGKVDNTTDIMHLTSGKGDSEGLTIIVGKKAMYIPNINPDLTNIIDLLTKIVEKMGNGILPSNSGGPIVSPTFVADLAQIQIEIKTLKEKLK